MLNYDYRNLLSAFEFECFSRDLINAHEGLDLMSFAEGRDKGVDLRYTSDRGKTVIVQAKRYKNYSELKSVLKKEVEKVKKLKPHRYMLVTSADLTDNNKKEIIALFAPYLNKESDILAKQDLNKILALHSDIERRYYKLWLASTDVLEHIIRKNVANWTSFEMKEIQEAVRTYVMNDSFEESLQKLLINHYVVISGEPGIGKTTLARILILHLLSDRFKEMLASSDYEEFYFTNSDINDLAGTMQSGKRQVFFYDDFMGRIALEEGEKNFDSRIISFIKACRAADDKLFILTTREYILQQGLVRYPMFTKGHGLEMSKCLVDMGKYTRFVRAQILYNHLVANDIPRPYIEALLEDKNYLKIIDHPHFSPRIIEAFLSNDTHKHCTPDVYFNIVKSYFDHPDEVWLDAFKRLSPIAQEALLVLKTLGTPVLCDDWREAYHHFFNVAHRETNFLRDSDWNDVVKVLHSSFIKTGRCPQGYYVEFHNPGVIEVLTRYIKNDDEVKRLLLENSLFVEQVLGVFIDERRSCRHSSIPPSFYTAFTNAFDKCWINFKSCKMSMFKGVNDSSYYSRNPWSRVDALYRLVFEYKDLLRVFPGYVEQKMTQDVMKVEEGDDFFTPLSLLEKVDISKTPLDMEELFANYNECLFCGADSLNFAASIKTVFPNHADYLESDEFASRTADNLSQELSDIRREDIEELESTAKELCKYIPSLEYYGVIDDINNASEEYSHYLESMAEAYQDDYHYHRGGSESEAEKEIDDLFATIRQ